jgi:hypothetical protein
MSMDKGIRYSRLGGLIMTPSGKTSFWILFYAQHFRITNNYWCFFWTNSNIWMGELNVSTQIITNQYRIRVKSKIYFSSPYSRLEN